MFQRLANLLFGSTNEPSQEPTAEKTLCPEVDDEGWLLINASDGEELSDIQPSPASVNVRSLSSTEILAVVTVNEASNTETDVPVARPRARVSLRLNSQSQALAKVTRVSRVQRAQARSNRHGLGRSCSQRQNRTHQHLPQHCSHIYRAMLHQPSARNLRN